MRSMCMPSTLTATWRRSTPAMCLVRGPIRDWPESFPTFLTIVGIPLTYNMSSGIGFGFVSWTIIKLLQGRAREVHRLMFVISTTFATAFVMGKRGWLRACTSHDREREAGLMKRSNDGLEFSGALFREDRLNPPVGFLTHEAQRADKTTAGGTSHR